MEEVTIAQRFCGPPKSGNGGYSCGLLGKHIQGTCQVRLHQPPPLDKPLSISESAGDWSLKDGEQLIGSAKPAELAMVPPAPPTLEQARSAQKHYRGHQHHSFPTCFVCGPARSDGDGLRLFCGAVQEREIVACEWQVHKDLLDHRGNIKSQFIWAALDCPSYFALKTGKTCLLGQMTCAIGKPISGNKPLIVYAWQRSIDGRKHFTAAAISNCDGEILACAEHLWIEIKSSAE
jgi:hypothetical protein